eukprot:4295520-Amphidinium_carterae.1
MAHRFWIEADAVPIFVGEGGLVVAAPEMRVRKHLLQRSASGGLVDASMEDEDGDDSPEAEFARRATVLYDEIACYFPEFARLKEIAKVCALARYLQNFRQRLEMQRKELAENRRAMSQAVVAGRMH